MKTYQTGSVKVIIIIIIVIGLAAFFFLKKDSIKSSYMNSDSTPSYGETCKGVSDFSLPPCIQAVAIYNNDKTICENISVTAGGSGGSHNVDFKKSCIESIETGTLVDRKFELNKEVSFGKADALARENWCKDAVAKTGKVFIPSDTPWNKSSLNGYLAGDEKSSVTLLTCSGY